MWESTYKTHLSDQQMYFQLLGGSSMKDRDGAIAPCRDEHSASGN